MSEPTLSPEQAALVRAIRRLEERFERAGAGQVFVPVAELSAVLQAASDTLPRTWRSTPEIR